MEQNKKSNQQTLEIPEGVTELELKHANNRNIQSIILPTTLKKICDYAFTGCTSLQSISVPEGVTTIGKRAFEGCRSLQSVMLPQSLEQIDDGAFFECDSLQSINVPEGVTTIGDDIFYGCTSLQSAMLPQSLQEICIYTFFECKSLQSISIPEGVTKIGEEAFSYCYSLQLVILPQSLEEIEYGAFYECTSLQSIFVPEGVTTIGNLAFKYCTSLQLIALPPTCNAKYKVFENCDELESTFQDDITNQLLSCFNHLPLHQYCYNFNHQTSTTTTILSSLQNNDQALVEQDAMGMTPLHVLCFNPCATSTLIKQLVMNNPATAQIRSSNGIIPLHAYLISQCIISYHDYEHFQSNDIDNVSQNAITLLQDEAGCNIHNMMLMGLEYNLMDVILALNGRCIELKLNEQNVETGLYPFMRAAISNHYKLHDVYKMARASIQVILSSS